MYCPMVNAERRGQSSLCKIVLRADLVRFEYWNMCYAVFNKETTQKECFYNDKTFLVDTYDYLLKASELESTLTVVSTGMEGYNIMIEHWGSAASEYPFSLPSGVPPLIIKLFSWKSSLFLNYLGRWSGNYIFCGGQSFLREREKRTGGKLIKRCENYINWISVRKTIYGPYPWVWQEKSNQGLQTLQLSTDEEITFFPSCLHIYKRKQREDPMLLHSLDKLCYLFINLKGFSHLHIFSGRTAM